MSRNNPKSSPKALEAKLRAAQGLELRLASKTWRDIAAELGYAGPSGAYQAVMGLMAETPAENIDEFRRLEVERLEGLRRELAPFGTRDKDSLGAYLQVSDRIHRLLGIAHRHEHSGPGGEPVVIKVITGVPRASFEPPEQDSPSA